MNKLNRLEKARLEAKKGKLWFDGAITEKQAKADSRLSAVMVEHWYGVEYHKAEAASRGY